MSEAFHDRPFPRGALLGAAALVSLAILSATVVRVSGVGTTQMPAAMPIESRDLRFEDRADGAVQVYDTREQRTLAVLAPGTNGFVRGALRGLARERKRQDIGSGPPFRLTRWADGRVSLEDPSTGRRIDLDAFGSTNAQAFAWLLDAPRGSQ